MQTHRIDIYISDTERGPRDAVGITRNEQGDIVFEFADGGRLVFYPRGAPPETPDLRRVRDVVQNSVFALMRLADPPEQIIGRGLRLLPSEPTAAHGPGKAPRPTITIKDAAKICTVTDRTIHAWERGKGTPNGWPGRCDILTLKAFANQRNQERRLRRAARSIVSIGAGERLSKADRRHQEAQEGFRRCAMPLKQEDLEDADEN